VRARGGRLKNLSALFFLTIKQKRGGKISNEKDNNVPGLYWFDMGFWLFDL